jgi:hypothetical protein
MQANVVVVTFRVANEEKDDHFPDPTVAEIFFFGANYIFLTSAQRLVLAELLRPLLTLSFPPSFPLLLLLLSPSPVSPKVNPRLLVKFATSQQQQQQGCHVQKEIVLSFAKLLFESGGKREKGKKMGEDDVRNGR